MSNPVEQQQEQIIAKYRQNLDKYRQNLNEINEKLQEINPDMNINKLSDIKDKFNYISLNNSYPIFLDSSDFYTEPYIDNNTSINIENLHILNNYIIYNVNNILNIHNLLNNKKIKYDKDVLYIYIDENNNNNIYIYRKHSPIVSLYNINTKTYESQIIIYYQEGHSKIICYKYFINIFLKKIFNIVTKTTESFITDINTNESIYIIDCIDNDYYIYYIGTSINDNNLYVYRLNLITNIEEKIVKITSKFDYLNFNLFLYNNEYYIKNNSLVFNKNGFFSYNNNGNNRVFDDQIDIGNRCSSSIFDNYIINLYVDKSDNITIATSPNNYYNINNLCLYNRITKTEEYIYYRFMCRHISVFKSKQYLVVVLNTSYNIRNNTSRTMHNIIIYMRKGDRYEIHNLG